MRLPSAFLLLLLLLTPALAPAQTPPATPPLARIIIIAIPSHTPAPPLTAAQVQVWQGKQADTINELHALKGDEGGIALYLLMDDDTPILAPAMNDLRTFLGSMPANTSLGIGYLRNGTVEIAQQLTRDHAAALAALHLPVGTPGISPNPFESVTALVKQWPAGPELRREVIMISDGAQHVGTKGPDSPTLLESIATAQQSGVIVLGIHIGKFISGGLFNLLTQRTGGDLCPWLSDIASHINNQYQLAFVPQPAKAPGPASIKVQTTASNYRLLAPDAAFLP